jgi:hypothetical protein
MNCQKSRSYRSNEKNRLQRDLSCEGTLVRSVVRNLHIHDRGLQRGFARRASGGPVGLGARALLLAHHSVEPGLMCEADACGSPPKSTSKSGLDKRRRSPVALRSKRRSTRSHFLASLTSTAQSCFAQRVKAGPFWWKVFVRHHAGSDAAETVRRVTGVLVIGRRVLYSRSNCPGVTSVGNLRAPSISAAFESD